MNYFIVIIFRIVFLLLSISIIPLSASGDNSPFLKVRGDFNYPPYEYILNGLPTGFNVDVMMAVSDVLGIDIKIDLGPWSEVRTQLELGEIDAVCGMFYSEERAEKVDFSTPFIVVSHSLFIKDGAGFQSLSEFEGKIVAVQQGDIMHDYIRANYPEINILERESQEEALWSLSSGEAEAALLAKLQGLYVIHESGIQDIEAVGPPILPREYCIAVSKENGELLAQINEGLSLIKTTGEYSRIFEKWFGVYEDSTLKKALNKVFWFMAPLILGIFVLGLWSWSLKRTVKKKTIELEQDIFQRKKTEVERERLILELENTNEELERFVYTASHDLRTPLVTISGFLGLLESDIEDDKRESVGKDIEHISKAVLRMDQLLNDLLDFSRVGRQKDPGQDVDLAGLMVEIEQNVQGIMIQSGTELEIQKNMPIVYGEKTRLMEVFQNLIENGVKYSRRTENPKIEVGYSEFDGETTFHVRDNGMGIEKKYVEKVFGLFEQLNPDVEGTGIGLAVVKRIVENHGGRIWLESDGRNQGTTFYFTLSGRCDIQ